MSAIVGLFGNRLNERIKPLLNLLRHRGDETRIVLGNRNFTLGSVASSSDGYFSDGTTAAVLDGRFFNLAQLSKRERIKGRNSAELLLRLWQRRGQTGLKELDGEFAFVIADGKDVILGRDRFGYKPLYHAIDGRSWALASEFKAIPPRFSRICHVPPGSGVILNRLQGFNLSRRTRPEPLLTDVKYVTRRLRELLTAAVAKRLDPNERTGILLSGGIDSATVACVARRLSDKLVSFTVGTREGPDLGFAGELARRWGLEAHQLVYNTRDLMSVLPKTIFHLESYDAPLVRSSVANFLATRLARRHGVRRVLIGEGGDELFAGYDQLKRLPVNRLNRALWTMMGELYNGGLQRCDRMPQAHGVEATIPFLDINLFHFAFSIAPELKIHNGVEKWILRKAFDGLMPGEVVWRPKQRFAAGAGSLESINKAVPKLVTAGDLTRAQKRWPQAGIRTTEELHYFRIFREFFPNRAVLPLIGRTAVI